MAEAVGLAASVAGLAALAGKVADICKTFVETAHDAPKELRSVLLEISTLQTILGNLSLLSRCDPEFRATFAQQTGIHQAVDGCREGLETLISELGSLKITDPNEGFSGRRSKRARLQDSVKYVFKEKEIKKSMNNIMQHKATITLGLLHEVVQDVKQVKTTLDEAKLRELCSWLQTTNPSENHNVAKELHEDHTGTWIHSCPEWQGWLGHRYRFLWVHGIPGAGKTVLASYMIETVESHCKRARDRDNTKSYCIYYYCTYRRQSDECLPFLAWVVGQLCRIMEYVPQNLLDLYHLNEKPDQTRLKSALATILDDVDHLYLTVDAIDESIPREDLLLLVKDLVTDSRFRKIHLLATSREYVDIEATFRTLSLPISMSNEWVHDDIRTFIVAELKEHFSKWHQNVRDQILDALVKGSGGMFRWVVCQLSILRRKRTREDIVRALNTLPETLYETYERILLNIPHEDWPLAKTIFGWICGHERLGFKFPLPLEFVLAAVLDSQEHPVSNGADNIYDAESVKEICSCLLSVGEISDQGICDMMDYDYDNYDGHEPQDDASGDTKSHHYVSFSHYTIREYLCSDKILSTPTKYFAISDDDFMGSFVPTIMNSSYRVLASSSSTLKRLDFATYCCLCSNVLSSRIGTEICAQENLWELQKKLFRPLYLSPKLYFLGEIFIILQAGFSCFMPNYSTCSGEFTPNTDTSTKRETENAIILAALLQNDCFEVADRYSRSLHMQAVFRASIPFRLPFFGTQTPKYNPILHYFADIAVSSRTDYSDQIFWLVQVAKNNDWLHPDELLIACISIHYCKLHCVRWGKSGDCLVQWLLEHGSSPNPDLFSVTPLQVAAHTPDPDGLALLLKTGAEPNAVGRPGGKMPLMADVSICRASPLHIIRSADAVHEGKKGIYHDLPYTKEELPGMEELLLKYGARDFVVRDDGTIEEFPITTT